MAHRTIVTAAVIAFLAHLRRQPQIGLCRPLRLSRTKLIS